MNRDEMEDANGGHDANVTTFASSMNVARIIGGRRTTRDAKRNILLIQHGHKEHSSSINATTLNMYVRDKCDSNGDSNESSHKN